MNSLVGYTGFVGSNLYEKGGTYKRTEVEANPKEGTSFAISCLA